MCHDDSRLNQLQSVEKRRPAPMMARASLLGEREGHIASLWASFLVAVLLVWNIWVTAATKGWAAAGVCTLPERISA